MRSRREMSVKQFERRHPDLRLHYVRPSESPNPRGFIALITRGGEDYVLGQGKTPKKAIYDASERCYKLASLEAMDRADWKDQRTGQTGIPLQAHHKKHRAHGRNDSPKNLEALSVESHRREHEKTPSPSEA